jgi:hypothetical protein
MKYEVRNTPIASMLEVIVEPHARMICIDDEFYHLHLPKMVFMIFYTSNEENFLDSLDHLDDDLEEDNNLEFLEFDYSKVFVLTDNDTFTDCPLPNSYKPVSEGFEYFLGNICLGLGNRTIEGSPDEIAKEVLEEYYSSPFKTNNGNIAYNGASKRYYEAWEKQKEMPDLGGKKKENYPQYLLSLIEDRIKDEDDENDSD